MGITDKAKNTAQKASGKAKEAVGRETRDRDLEAKGRKDQIAADLKNAGEKVKDALKH
jgi:uncharacterized protein YjbJ (UPF0337 family)